MIIVFDGFIQFFYSKNIFGYPPFLMADTYRLSGFFKDELIIGSFISRILPFYLGLYMYCKYLNIIGNKDGYVSLFLLISCVLVLLSGERVALFYAFLSILMGALLINFLNIKWFLKLFTVGLIFISIILTHEGSKKRLIDKTLNQIGISNSKEELTDNDQIYIYSIHHHYHIVAAYKIFKDNIMFGSGVKMFREVCKDGYRENVFSCTTHPHNTIMQFLSETGIVGISFYFLSLFYVLKFMSINLWLLISNKDNNLYKAKIFYLLALLISLMPLLPSGNFFNNWISIINYLPVGFYLLSNKKNEL
ncbi:O-antigen ligase family protein [Candidatus Pelagibacter sp. Uisw_094]|uniref:O-antigen ligase family protein n=1 Tax=Candidatus Pelagibacter sp. Uisw_094 TaxID=3230980 RepID=UPI0039EC4A04